VAVTLWNYLSEDHSQYHSRAVSLLYQLHQLSPDPWTCEDVICSALLSPDKVPALYFTFFISLMCLTNCISLLSLKWTFFDYGCDQRDIWWYFAVAFCREGCETLWDSVANVVTYSSNSLCCVQTIRLHAHSCFAVLWHLLRDKMTSPAPLTRGTQSSLFDRLFFSTRIRCVYFVWYLQYIACDIVMICIYEVNLE